jgi:hypothetical protein
VGRRMSSQFEPAREVRDVCMAGTGMKTGAHYPVRSHYMLECPVFCFY